METIMSEIKNKEYFEKLSLNKKPVWDKLLPTEIEEIFLFSEGYKDFLDLAKTEREAVNVIHRRAVASGFVHLDNFIGPIDGYPGFYHVNRDKNIALVMPGQTNPVNGVRMILSHIDSPRLDLKPNPLCESHGMAFLRTHYYGGIKKYQWVCRPLAIHGRIIRADNGVVDICIGENVRDPVFVIGDLLPHLAKTQNEKKLDEIVSAEKLKIIVGSMPLGDDAISQRLKFRVLDYLFKTYGIVEEDFVSAELEIVPAEKARDVGFDRSMVGAYGQDDRACVYASLTAMFEMRVGKQKHASVVFFLDKEEIGSEGNTGAQSVFIEETMGKLLIKSGVGPFYCYTHQLMSASKAISADVAAAVDPDWEEAHELQNAAILGYGVAVNKYSGSRGKVFTSDANAEYVGKIRQILNKSGIIWQASELGKVDFGGGGTIAKFLANRGIDVIDMGVPVVAMHSPCEITSKADVFMAYRAYKAFLESD